MFGRFIDYRLVAFVVLSIAAHLFVVVFGEKLYNRSSRNVVGWAQHAFTRPLFDDPIEVDLPTLAAETIDGKLIELPPIEIPPTGGEAVPRPDTKSAGNGGENAGETADNLADRQDDRSLTTAIPNRFDRSQVPRIDSGRDRASREDWRASREPMELTFLASGRTATRPERRQFAVHNPSMGARWSGQAAHAGGALGEPEAQPGATEAPRPVGGTLPGAEEETPGVGVRDGNPGKDARESAPVPLARPWVTQATPSIPADEKDKPRDTVDSEQEVAPAPESIVHATTPGGTNGQGTGGQTGPTTTPGSGGQTGSGSESRPNGDGRGPDVAQFARDARRNDYLRRVSARISRLYSPSLFPKWAIAEGRGGRAIVSFVIQRDGSITGVRVSRSSSIAEYDENCRRVILKVGSFDPLPPELGTFQPVNYSFDSPNPAVR